MTLHHRGFPIRKSAGRSLFAAHRSLSQLVTSFIGSWCQGIHLTLLFAWTSCIMYLTILWFSLNCLSFFELYVQDYWLSYAWKDFYSPFALVTWVCFHLSVKLYFPFSFGKTYNLDYLSSSVRFLLKSFFYSVVKDLWAVRLWSVWMDSNHRPRAYQARALATWATNRNLTLRLWFVHLFARFTGWWRWRESNPWPPACRAGALPAELHPLTGDSDDSSLKIEQQ